MEFDLCLQVRAAETLPACAKAVFRAAGQSHTVHVYGWHAARHNSDAIRLALGDAFPGAKSADDANSARAMNMAAGQGGAPWLLFLDSGLALEPNFFDILEQAINKNPQAGGFLCRRLPWRQAPHVNPVTLETAVLEHGLSAVSREAYSAVGGRDPRMPAPVADHDFSLRLRRQHGPLYYAPGACAFAAPLEDVPSDGLADYVEQTVAPLFFARKYGDGSARRRAGREYRSALRAPQHFAGVRKALLRRYLQYFTQVPPLRAGKGEKGEGQELCAEYPPVSRGSFARQQPFAGTSPIGVVVRTSGRPHMLQGALESLCNQTLAPARVVVAEDGPPDARELAEEYAGRLPLVYFATQNRVGRAKVGNMGLAQAGTSWLNFLDDDDYFYPEHIEEMSFLIANSPGADLFLGCATASGRSPGAALADIGPGARVEPMLFDRIDAFTMCQMCRIPIQSGVFSQHLFQLCGGLEESLEADEDWAMWLRFLSRGRRAAAPEVDCAAATSLFTVPAGSEAAQARLAQYGVWDRKLFEELDIPFTLNQADLRGFYDDVIADMRHLARRGELEAYLEQQARRNDHWKLPGAASPEE